MNKFIFGGDFFIFISLFSTNIMLMSLISKKFSLLHLVMIAEMMIISVAILSPSNASILTNFPDGELFALFAVAIAAAETALILTLFIFLRKNNTEN